MSYILNLETFSSNDIFTIVLLCLASFRIWLEIIGVDFSSLPITKYLSKGNKEDQLKKFHRMGLIFSIGYIVLFAPTVLF